MWDGVGCKVWVGKGKNHGLGKGPGVQNLEDLGGVLFWGTNCMDGWEGGTCMG